MYRWVDTGWYVIAPDYGRLWRTERCKIGHGFVRFRWKYPLLFVIFLTGLIYDFTGSYTLAFIILSGLHIFAFLAFLVLADCFPGRKKSGS